MYILLLFAVSFLSLECGASLLWSLQSLTGPLFALQIKMLTDRKRELEHRLSAMMEENDLLQGTVEELQDRVLILERQSHDKDLQVRSETGRGWEDAVKVMIWGKIWHKEETEDRMTGRMKWLMQEWQQARSWVFPMKMGNRNINKES